MILRIFWASFLVIAGLSFWGMFSESIPKLKSERDAFHHLMDDGVPGRAVLKTKLDRQVRIGFNDHAREYNGILSLNVNGREFIKNIPYEYGPLVKENWEGLREGDLVDVVYLKEDPSQFYAPSFLKYGEKSAGPNAAYWTQVALAILAGMLWIFAFARLVIWPRSQGRQISSGTAFQR